MSPYELPGLVGGIAGTWLFLLGVLLAVGGALRVVWVLRRPGAGRVARGVLAGGGVVGAGGILLFWGAQASPWRAAFDRAAPLVALGSVALGAALAVLVARRRPRAGPGEA